MLARSNQNKTNNNLSSNSNVNNNNNINFNNNNANNNFLAQENNNDNIGKKIRQNMTPSNLFLPQINENNNIYNNIQRNTQSREREKFEMQNSNDNYQKQTNSSQNDQFMMEINNLKKIIKKLLENQTEAQTRINDYTKIFSEQENIARINNLKLNEHDSKITEILMTFNNYLNLNDQSNKVINDLSSNYDVLAKKTDVAEIKNKFTNFDKIMDGKLLDVNGKYEDLLVKYQEISK